MSVGLCVCVCEGALSSDGVDLCVSVSVSVPVTVLVPVCPCVCVCWSFVERRCRFVYEYSCTILLFKTNCSRLVSTSLASSHAPAN